MTILLIRHGQTKDNKSKRVQLPDARLSLDGEQQALRLADRIKHTGITHILCSDYERTRQTADPLVSVTGIRCEFSPLLRERNFGDLRGQAYGNIGEDFFAPDYVPSNGESWEEFDHRVAKAWQLILQKASETAGKLAVITHGLVCLRIVSNHTKVDDAALVPNHWANTSITEIDSSSPFRVNLLNCDRHLETGLKSSSHGGKV